MTRLFRLIVRDSDAKRYVKWEPYGLAFLKPVIYHDYDGRPVLYLSAAEYHEFVVEKGLVDKLAWRVVEFCQDIKSAHEDIIDFTHEREWRVPGEVNLAKLVGCARPLAIVNNLQEREQLLADFAPGTNGPVRGVISIADLCLLG